MHYKGGSNPAAPITKLSMVGGINGKANDVPLLVCNTNLLSDAVDSGLRRQGSGPGYIHFPKPKHPTVNPNGWLSQAFFDELNAEVRDPNGTWRKIRKRNEAFDCCRMIHAGILRLGLDKLEDWSLVPAWLAPLDRNSNIVLRSDRQAMQANTPIIQQEVRVIGEVRRVRRSAQMAR